MRIILLLLICLLVGCENPNKTYIDIQTIKYDIHRSEVLKETTDAYMIGFVGYENWLPKNEEWIWVRGRTSINKARFVPKEKVEEIIDVWRKERK